MPDKFRMPEPRAVVEAYSVRWTPVTVEELLKVMERVHRGEKLEAMPGYAVFNGELHRRWFE